MTDPDDNFVKKFISNYEEKIAEDDLYEYPNAAPYEAAEEVKKAVERWREEVPGEVKKNQPLLYWLLGTGTPEYKMSREGADVKHEPQNGGEKCGNCEYAYYSNKGDHIICSKVRGKFSDSDWCKFWEGVDNE